MDYEINIGNLFEKQIEFCHSKSKFTGYGGARGGGKTHVECCKATQLAVRYDGIRICIVRRTFPELMSEIVPKLQTILGKVAKFNTKRKDFQLPNGSTILLRHYTSEADSIDFQGQNYDVIFMDEATQFTESMFRVLTLCMRLSGRVDTKFKLQPRMYLTANPGGVGHMWFKRLFIDKDYHEGENANDYNFIPSLVFDNKFLMENNPDYVNQLKALPEKERMAMLYGDWNVFAGLYFEEFREELHTYEPFKVEIKSHWRKFRVRDYGLDKTACYWIAMDEYGSAYVYKELWQSNLTVKQSGDLINEMTLRGEEPFLDIVPPDLWNRQSQTGKSAVDILMTECKQVPTKANNDFYVGCMYLKDFLRVNEETGKPRLMISKDCPNLIKSISLIQHDEKNPNVYAKEPHELTHSVDAIRYFCTSYTFAPDPLQMAKVITDNAYAMFALNLGRYEEETLPTDMEDEYMESDTDGWFI